MITKYLLNAARTSGSAKARFFLGQGFSLSDPERRATSLKHHPTQALLKPAPVDPEGRRLVYECEIEIPDGSRTCIRSVWIEASDGSYARLISAYPFDCGSGRPLPSRDRKFMVVAALFSHEAGRAAP